MELRKFLLIITGSMVIMLIVTAWFFPSNEDFRIENPFWNGARDVYDAYPIQPLNSLDDLSPEPEGVTLITIPYISYTPAELEKLNSFVSRGGRLLLADDYGHGNQVLFNLGVEARFSGQILLDPLVNYKNERLPKIIHLQSDPLTAATGNLVFNHATGLANVAGDNVIALSSAFSFLDDNNNGIRDDDEPSGPFPVISRHEMGRGEVILIADPSLFINSMQTIEDNARFIENVAATSSIIFIDQSHLPTSELHHTKNILQRTRHLSATPWGTAGLIIVFITATLWPVWYRKKDSPDGI